MIFFWNRFGKNIHVSPCKITFTKRKIKGNWYNNGNKIIYKNQIIVKCLKNQYKINIY